MKNLTSKLPGAQQAPRSGILLLRVRAERNVSRRPLEAVEGRPSATELKDHEGLR